LLVALLNRSLASPFGFFIRDRFTMAVGKAAKRIYTALVTTIDETEFCTYSLAAVLAISSALAPVRTGVVTIVGVPAVRS
jgi:hypothetical protein